MRRGPCVARVADCMTNPGFEGTTPGAARTSWPSKERPEVREAKEVFERWRKKQNTRKRRPTSNLKKKQETEKSGVKMMRIG